MELVSIDPATRQEIGRIPIAEARDIELMLLRLRARGPTTLEERAAATIRRGSGVLAEFMTCEQGKILCESRAEVHNAADRRRHVLARRKRAFCDSSNGEATEIHREIARALTENLLHPAEETRIVH